MNRRFTGFFAINSVLLLIVAVLITACVSGKPVDQPVHVKLTECSKIVDRSERTRCIDAANRTSVQPHK